MYSRIY